MVGAAHVQRLDLASNLIEPSFVTRPFHALYIGARSLGQQARPH
jgi:hypothetical protein